MLFKSSYSINFLRILFFSLLISPVILHTAAQRVESAAPKSTAAVKAQPQTESLPVSEPIKGAGQTSPAQKGADTTRAMVVRIEGTASMGQVNELLQESFEQQSSKHKLIVQTNGSAAGLQALRTGKADIAAIGRDLTKQEQAEGFVAIPVKREKIALLVGDYNPYDGNMSTVQFADMFRGVVTGWSELEEKLSGSVRFVDHPKDSDTRLALSQYPAFQEFAFENGVTVDRLPDEKTETLVKALETDGISYLVISRARNLPGTRILFTHKVLPDNPKYPFSQSFSYVYRRGQLTPAAKVFLKRLNQPETVETLRISTVPGVKILLPNDAAIAQAVADQPALMGGAVNLAQAPEAEVPATSATASSSPQPDAAPWLWLVPVGLGVAFWAWRSRRSPENVASTGSIDATAAAPSSPSNAGDVSSEAMPPPDPASGIGAAAGATAASGVGDLPGKSNTDLAPPAAKSVPPTEQAETAAVDVARPDVTGLGAAVSGDAVEKGTSVSEAAASQDTEISVSDEFQPITQLPADTQSPMPKEESEIPFGQGRETAAADHADRLVKAEFDTDPTGCAIGSVDTKSSAAEPSDSELDTELSEVEPRDAELSALRSPELKLSESEPLSTESDSRLPEANLSEAKSSEVAPSDSARSDIEPSDALIPEVTAQAAMVDPPANLTADALVAETSAMAPEPALSDPLSPEPVPETLIPQEAGMSGLAAAALANATAQQVRQQSIDLSQTEVEAAKYNVGQSDPAIAASRFASTDLDAAALADVDDALPDLPDGYGEPRLMFIPRDPQWAYAYWDVPEADRQRLRAQGGKQLALRLYDVTDIDRYEHQPHSMAQQTINELARNWYVEIPLSDRDYMLELGYVADDDEWLPLVRSGQVRVPSQSTSDWVDDQMIRVDWSESLRGKRFADLKPPTAQGAGDLHDVMFKLSQPGFGTIAGSQFGSMHMRPADLGPGSWSLGASGNPSGIGQFAGGVSAQRPFWLVADAELIVYGATMPDATVTINGEPIALGPDGTFRLQIPFPDGRQDFPIMAVALDGEQTREIHLRFDRQTLDRQALGEGERSLEDTN